MKYRQLTKEQFLELHKEFSEFLATQQIDVKEWDTIKKEKPLMAEEELNIFSDVVWEDVLSKTEYLEHISKNDINLFKCSSKEIIRVYIKLNNETIFLYNMLAFRFKYCCFMVARMAFWSKRRLNGRCIVGKCRF